MAIYHVDLNFTFHGKEGSFGRYFKGPESYGGASEFAEALGQLIDTNLATTMAHTTFSFLNLYINEEAANGPGLTLTPSVWPWTGTNGGHTLGIGASINFRLGAVGTSYPVRGLIKWPCVFEGWQSSGSLAASQFPGLSATIAMLCTTVHNTSAGTWTPGLYSRKYDTFREITTVTNDTKWRRARKELV